MAPDLDGFDEPAQGTALTDEAVADRSDAVSAFTRVRVLTFAALGPLVIGYTAIAALLALVTAIATNTHFATLGVLGAALPGWLAAHQVPLSITGVELGALPLLPTIGFVALTARAASGAATRLRLYRPGQAGQVVVTITLAHGVAGAVLAGLIADEQVTADPLAAFYYPALVAAFAATVGVARRCGLLAAVVDRADAVAVAGLRAGAVAVALLLTAGGAVLTCGLLASIPTARQLFPVGTGNAVGMLLLSIGYLPNAVVAATSFVVGPGFSLGTVAMSPLDFVGGPVPGLPLLAAMPERQAAWWPLLFVLPLAIGVLVGRRLRNGADDPVARLRGVAVATGVVAVCFVLIVGSAGGRLGGGAFDPVSMRAAAVSIALVLWIAVPAAFATWFGGPRPARAAMPGLIDDEPEEEPDDDDLTDDEPDEPAAEDEPVEETEDVPAQRNGAEKPDEVDA
jgi:hypothetical protein